MAEKAFFVSIRGRVQGVGFRIWTERQARMLNLRGWVRNEPDGSVAALVGGAEDAVQTMLDLFRRGPSAARVDGVTASEAHPADLPGDFQEQR
jgi:acylphosphatase